MPGLFLAPGSGAQRSKKARATPRPGETLVHFACFQNVADHRNLQRKHIHQGSGRQMFAEEKPRPLGVRDQLGYPQLERCGPFRSGESPCCHTRHPEITLLGGVVLKQPRTRISRSSGDIRDCLMRAPQRFGSFFEGRGNQEQARAMDARRNNGSCCELEIGFHVSVSSNGPQLGNYRVRIIAQLDEC